MSEWLLPYDARFSAARGSAWHNSVLSYKTHQHSIPQIPFWQKQIKRQTKEERIMGQKTITSLTWDPVVTMSKSLGE